MLAFDNGCASAQKKWAHPKTASEQKEKPKED